MTNLTNMIEAKTEVSKHVNSLKEYDHSISAQVL